MQEQKFVPEGCLKEMFDRVDKEREAARRILELSAELHLTIRELPLGIVLMKSVRFRSM